MTETAQTSSYPVGAWLYATLSFVGGYGDAAGFVLAKSFTGHATGNLVLGAIAVAAADYASALRHFMSVVVFLLGVFLGAWAMRLRIPSQLSLVLVPELILVAAAPLALSAHLGGTGIFVGCVSLALGLQNGAFRRVGGMGVHTTYLTGMLTGLISSKAEQYSSHLTASAAAASNPKDALIVQVWIAFLLGAISGALATLHFEASGMLGIPLILVVVIVRSSTLRSGVGPAGPGRS
jgi:uncharacterized membrane protein YoaK (UPF0700 family)